jgi:hypothetical protein
MELFSIIIIIAVILIFVAIVVYMVISTKDSAEEFVVKFPEFTNIHEKMIFMFDNDVRLTDMIMILKESGLKINELNEIRSNGTEDFINRYINSGANLLVFIRDIKYKMDHGIMGFHTTETLTNDLKNLRKLFYMIIYACENRGVPCVRFCQFVNDFNLVYIIEQMDYILKLFEDTLIDEIDSIFKYALKNLFGDI